MAPSLGEREFADAQGVYAASWNEMGGMSR